jgi:hypothetical protein
MNAPCGDPVYGTRPEQPDTVFREPSLLEPILDLEMFLVRLGKPGEVEISPVLGFRMKVYDAEHVHQGFLLNSLSHVLSQKKLPQSRPGRKGIRTLALTLRALRVFAVILFLFLMFDALRNHPSYLYISGPMPDDSSILQAAF